MKLGHVGRWLTDERGRVVLLRGVNLVNKLPPYHPAAAGFDESHAAHLGGEGFNGVRLCMVWKAVEPEPGGYDDVYLDTVARVAALLGAQGIHVLLDFHQDLWNERFGGEGAPDWALPPGRRRTLPRIGFPLGYAVTPALWRAYDAFWANRAGPGGIGLQDRFAAAWRHVAERFRDEPHVFGYDVLNEPVPGSAAFTGLLPGGARGFGQTLAVFHRRVVARIREVDPRTLVFHEPGMLFGLGRDLGDETRGDPRTGLSFHLYCLAAAPGLPALPRPARGALCARLERRTFERADEHARRHGVALLLSEFGATDDAASLLRGVEAADRHRCSWLYWAYWNRDVLRERPAEGIVHDLRRPPEAGNVKQEKLDVLVRPYPRAVAGTPIRIAFEHAARELELVYASCAPGGGAIGPGERTEVVIPPRRYPEGYAVEVDGGHVLSRPGSRVLEVAAAPGADRVGLLVRPRVG
jgi:endoglycosylceramidase